MGLYESKNLIEESGYDFNNQSVEIDVILIFRDESKYINSHISFNFICGKILKEKEHIRVCTSMKGKDFVNYRYEDVKTIYDVLPKGLLLSCKYRYIIE